MSANDNDAMANREQVLINKMNVPQANRSGKRKKVLHNAAGFATRTP
jgi:hypothetical protein